MPRRFFAFALVALLAAGAIAGYFLQHSQMPDTARAITPQVATSAIRLRHGNARMRAVLAKATGARGPAIAIVIDDLGNDPVAARRAIALPPPVTLAFLPYPEATPSLARDAERAGHEVLVHLPMEPEGPQDAGPGVLKTNLPAEENLRRLKWALDRVPGFDGINNHMGSRFTADKNALAPVMRAIAARHVFVLDSRTTANTVIPPVADSFGVPNATRNVFLDDEETHGAIVAQLQRLEGLAKEQGLAIAIGHPYGVTLDALAKWTADTRLRGIVLVSVGEAVRLKARIERLRTTIIQ